ncbi:hypothetical protein E3N88_23198 [Mikania micrantha]|uniref:Uncharacterized protein n=1 Tax=Mikania micrantha TaxID=192012 RepID=A0A5N6NED9_9ASTR|nr:hypothetical protein E3N88_23198 [Mikania micrantha]
MCEIWNTKDWRKKSTSGKDNRSKTDRGGKTSRHTGGSIGYDEHRLRLAKYLQQMTKVYGLNFTQDDARVWARLHGNGGPKQLQDLKALLEIERKAREELEEQIKKMNEFMKKFTHPDN